MKRALGSVVSLAGLTLAACTHHPTIAYPKVMEAGAVESIFDCAALDDAILKTEAVRWVMRQDGARLLSPDERMGRGTVDVASFAASCVFLFVCAPMGELGDEGHDMLDRADRRLLSLLKLKQSKACPARDTSIANMSDLDMYDKVADLVAQESAKMPSMPIGDLRAERMRLLDGLRP
jgi:hypothetical protein